MSRKHLSRITFENFAFGAVEYSVDGDPVSFAGPLNGAEKAEQVPFYVEMPVVRPLATEGPAETRTVENWVSHEVTDYNTGIIFYAQSAKDADHMAYKIAESYLLRKLINIDKI